MNQERSMAQDSEGKEKPLLKDINWISEVLLDCVINKENPMKKCFGAIPKTGSL